MLDLFEEEQPDIQSERRTPKLIHRAARKGHTVEPELLFQSPPPEPTAIQPLGRFRVDLTQRRTRERKGTQRKSRNKRHLINPLTEDQIGGAVTREMGDTLYRLGLKSTKISSGVMKESLLRVLRSMREGISLKHFASEQQFRDWFAYGEEADQNGTICGSVLPKYDAWRVRHQRREWTLLMCQKLPLLSLVLLMLQKLSLSHLMCH